MEQRKEKQKQHQEKPKQYPEKSKQQSKQHQEKPKQHQNKPKPHSDKPKQYPDQAKRKGRILYSVCALVLVVLVLCALFLPRFLFSLQDDLLCRQNLPVDQEEFDVTVLSADYEPSLKERLLRFVSGLAQGNSYYVSEQVLTPNEEILSRVVATEETDSFLNQTPYYVMYNLGLAGGFHSVKSQKSMSIDCWKQYTVYGDDLSEGVNFILWYLEITDSYLRMKLLLDAQDFTIYGMCIEDLENIFFYDIDHIRDAAERIGNTYEVWETDWVMILSYYQCIDEEELRELEEIGFSSKERYDWEGDTVVSREESLRKILELMERQEIITYPTEDVCFMRLPCDDRELKLSIRIFSESGKEPSAYTNGKPTRISYFGLDDICDLVPEMKQRL